MKVIVHTEFERFTHKALGGTIGILSYALLVSIWTSIDLAGATVIAFLMGSAFWFLLSYLVTRSNGLCIEFRYSKIRPGLSVVALWRGFKQLGQLELDVTLDKDGNQKLTESQALAKLNYFLNRYLYAIDVAKTIHFVGCRESDADKICMLIGSCK